MIRASTTRFFLAAVTAFLLLAPSTRAEDITPPTTSPPLPTLFLIGDSTVKNGSGKGDGGLWGWGAPIADLFDPTKIRVDNRALGGTSSRSYLAAGLWEKVLADVKPGDFVVMQFGHNDGGSISTGPAGRNGAPPRPARASIKGAGDESEEVTDTATGKKEVVHTYGWYLRKYIADTKAKGATPIVLSPIPRNSWKDKTVNRASNDYGKWAAEAAKAEGVAFVDLNDIIARHYEEIGPEKVLELYFTAADHTHTTAAGAKLNAACVVEGLRGLKDCPLCAYLAAPVETRPKTDADSKK